MPLRDSEAFVSLMTKFSNPILGILAGAAFTALIQSSSASVGILQALAVSGAISLSSAVFVLFGQNIGTCITAVLASIGTSRNAKRATIIHLMFNIIGIIIFYSHLHFLPAGTCDRESYAGEPSIPDCQYAHTVQYYDNLVVGSVWQLSGSTGKTDSAGKTRRER